MKKRLLDFYDYICSNGTMSWCFMICGFMLGCLIAIIVKCLLVY